MNHYKFTLFLIVILLGMGACKEETPLPDAFDTLQADPDFSQFVEMIEYADLEEVLKTSTLVTILAPNNQAVDSFLVEEGYDEITDIPKDLLIATILYHIQQGSITEDQLVSGYFLTPAVWKDNFLVILIDKVNGEIIFNNKAKIIQNDISALNGVIQKIDAVLPIPNILDFLESNPQFDHLVEAIDRGGLRSLFTGNGPYTLFAPVNDAFEDYFDIKSGVADLDDLTDQELKDIVLTHTLSGNHRLADFTVAFGNKSFDNLYPDGELKISVPTDVAIVNDTVSTILMDIQATNGVMHVVTGIVEPK